MTDGTALPWPKALVSRHALFMVGVGLSLLYAASINFTLFHTIAELFTVFVAVSIFIIAWNSRAISGDGFIQIIGQALLFVGILDLLHTLSYEGLSILDDSDYDLPVSFWIAARYLEAAAFLGALAFADRRLPRNAALVVTSVPAVALAVIIMGGHFPDTFVPGEGLTPFKIGSEMLVAGAKLVVAYLLLRLRILAPAVRHLLVASLVLSAAYDGVFTLYDSLHDNYIVLGHLLKVLAFYLLYKAVAETALVQPFNVMFLDLQASREMLEAKVRERTAELAHANALLRMEVEARALAEARAKRANAALEALFKASPLATVALDRHGRVSLWNRAAEDLFGWRREEVLGKPDPAAPKSFVESGLHGVFQDGLETIRQRRDGGSIEVRICSGPMLDEKGRAHGVISVFTDVTEEKRSLRALAESEARLRGIMENVADAILTVEEDGRIETVNAAGAAMFGIGRREVAGLPIDDLLALSGEAGGALSALVGKPAFQLNARRRDGEAFPAEMMVNVMDLGVRRLFVLVVRDVSERVQVMQERAALQEELAMAHKMEALGSLAGSIAHEVNNMLVPIVGLTETVIERLPEDDSNRKALDSVLAAAHRTKHIVRQVLAFSRMQPLQTGPLSLAKEVREGVSLLRSTLPSNIALECVIKDENIVVFADATRVNQILLNLAANSVHALGLTGGTIRFLVERRYLDRRALAAHPRMSPGWYAALDVSDTGSGMEECVAAKIFEPFFTTKAVGEGTGMGLPVVHGIVSGWGGIISVDSTPGEGTRFVIYLPVHESSGEVSMTGTSPASGC